MAPEGHPESHGHSLLEVFGRQGSDVFSRQLRWVAKDTGFGAGWVGVQALPCDMLAAGCVALVQSCHL